MTPETKHKQLDEQFEHFLDSVVIDVTESELTPERRQRRRQEADKNNFKFCKIYFPSIFEDPWNKLHKHINKLKEGFHTVSGSRWFGKSAFTYVTRIVKPIALGGIGLIGLGLRNQSDSEERSDAIVRMIKRNKLLMYDYGINIQQDKKGHYIINNKELITFGFREGLRNIFDEEFDRFETIILDDLFNRISVESEKDNEKIYNFIVSEVLGQLNPDGLGIWLFNYISDGSPGYRYADEHPKTHFNLPALNDKDETNWEGSFWSTKELRRKRDSIPYEVWMGDWMNDPVLLGEIMDKDWLNPVNINLIKLVASLTAIDPAHGVSPSACYKGMATLGITEDFTTVMIDIRIRKEGYVSVFDYIDSIRESTPLWKVLLFENDFNQFDMAQPYYQQWQEMRKKHLPIFRFSTKMLETEFYGTDKESRMMNLVFPHQQGKFLYNEAIMKSSDFKRYKAGYLGFGKEKKKLDGFDATASAFIMLPRYIVTGTFKVLKKRTYRNPEDSWLNRGKLFRR